MDDLWFSDWRTIQRTLLVGIAAYVALVVLLRVSGKRTLSKLNAFDFIVTVALGSTLATILVGPDVAFAEGVTALIVLIGMQYVVTWMQLRSRRFRGLVKAEPTLLFYRGDFVGSHMRTERVTEEEVLAAARSEGLASLSDVEAVVLETDSSISVVQKRPEGSPSSMSTVEAYGEKLEGKGTREGR